MKNVLIIGVTGTFGKQIAQALVSSGFTVKALMRDTKKLPSQLKDIELIEGDVNDIGTIRKACKDVEFIVYGVNPPYPQWASYAELYLNNMATVAEEMKLTIVFPGNVYSINPEDGTVFFEDHRSNQSPTKKGEIRNSMEIRLQQAATNGARVVVLRMGDFVAVESASSWLTHLVKLNKNGYTLLSPGNESLRHTWAFVPDAVDVITVLLLSDKLLQLPSYSVFNFKGYQISIEDIALAIQAATNKPVKIKSFPWWFIKLGSLFSKNLKELLEMRYLWDVEINLDDQKIKKLLGELYPVETSLESALIQTKLL